MIMAGSHGCCVIEWCVARTCGCCGTDATADTFLFQRRTLMNIAIEPLLALVVGILILIVPRFLNYFVAVYLIVLGVLGLMHHVTLT